MKRAPLIVSIIIIGLMSAPAVKAAGASSATDTSRMIEIVLDASGSMNGRLGSGEMKIDAAKTAVKYLAEKMPDSLILAFRAYGHQSPREKKDCLDTQLLVAFSPLDAVREDIISGVEGLKAQGYTPITYVLETAAGDFPAGGDIEKIIILVSDGKETCEGDPCVTAKILKENHVSLAVHTIGLGVDSVTRDQLDCISRMSGGKYFDAETLDELIRVLSEAVETAAVIPVESKESGRLAIEGADLRGHRITNAETGEDMGSISNVNSTIKLPAGIYNVTVGKAEWKSVEVKEGETTTLRPGILSVNNASFRGHIVADAETGEAHGEVSSRAGSITIMPGNYTVSFGKILWPVTIKEGERTIVNAGWLSVDGASYRGHRIRTLEGTEIGSVSNTGSSFTLPPGEYTVEIEGKKVQFNIKEGQQTVIKVD